MFEQADGTLRTTVDQLYAVKMLSVYPMFAMADTAAPAVAAPAATVVVCAASGQCRRSDRLVRGMHGRGHKGGG